jgi:hypothetical protein
MRSGTGSGTGAGPGCKDCGGASMFEHNRRRSACKGCGAASICKTGLAETLASMFNAQDLANTLCVLWLVSQDSLCASASQGLEAAREQSYEGHKGVQCGERERASEIA